ncbi:MAG: hypothetical protein EOP45_17335 [Sphingobacteriaceae bacterium]|nr:MAG: hypothetical protein EOP45_17335 [Sphingobacteriaceae bacterium]
MACKSCGTCTCDDCHTKLLQFSTTPISRLKCPQESCNKPVTQRLKEYLHDDWIAHLKRFSGFEQFEAKKELYIEEIQLRERLSHVENALGEKHDDETKHFFDSRTKKCPNCSISVIKDSGCSSVWCGNCRSYFNWDTLTVQQSGHNPDAIALTLSKSLESEIYRRQTLVDKLHLQHVRNEIKTVEYDQSIINHMQELLPLRVKHQLVQKWQHQFDSLDFPKRDSMQKLSENMIQLAEQIAKQCIESEISCPFK